MSQALNGTARHERRHARTKVALWRLQDGVVEHHKTATSDFRCGTTRLDLRAHDWYVSSAVRAGASCKIGALIDVVYNYHH